MIFINILMFFQSDSTLFSVTHQGVLHVNQQIPTLKFYNILYLESRITFGKCRVSYTICIVLPNHQEGTTNWPLDPRVWPYDRIWPLMSLFYTDGVYTLGYNPTSRGGTLVSNTLRCSRGSTVRLVWPYLNSWPKGVTISDLNESLLYRWCLHPGLWPLISISRGGQGGRL